MAKLTEQQKQAAVDALIALLAGRNIEISDIQEIVRRLVIAVNTNIGNREL